MVKLVQGDKDKISGFSGVVTARAEYISGCNQALCCPLVHSSAIHDPYAHLTPSQCAAEIAKRLRHSRMSIARPTSMRAEIGVAAKATEKPIETPAQWAERQKERFKEPWFQIVGECEPLKPKIEDIQRVVARQYNVSRSDLLSSRRTADVVRPRQVAMYLAKTLTLRSLPEIGRRFGGRDHTTVLHAVRKIEALVAKDVALSEEVEFIRGQIT